MAAKDDEYLTLPAAVARLGLAIDTVRKKVRAGVLDDLFVRIADRRFIRVADLPRVKELLAARK